MNDDPTLPAEKLVFIFSWLAGKLADLHAASGAHGGDRGAVLNAWMKESPMAPELQSALSKARKD